MRKFISLFLTLMLFFASKPIWSREIGPKWLERNYKKIEQMVPMRDGISLYTSIYLPRDNKPHPVILVRTPYGLNPYGKSFSHMLRSSLGPYSENRYIIVLQNVRGTFLSEGEYEQIRPVKVHAAVASPAGSPEQILTDETSDAYDTAEWIIANLPTNGNIGVSGVSYNGFYASAAALSAHPAIKAVSPQAPVTDWYMGDDAHISGIYCNSAYNFGTFMFQRRRKPTIRNNVNLEYSVGDCYDWFLEKGSLNNLLETYKDSLPFQKQIMEHPHYDSFWQERNIAAKLRDIRPAMLVVGGWFDAEDAYGTFETYRKLLELSPQTETYLVSAPWCHGGWNKYELNNLGDAWFGTGSARYYMSRIEYPFFAWYLEGKGEKPSYKAAVLPSAETMKSRMENHSTEEQWEFLDNWPPKEAVLKKLYLNDLGRLSCEQGQGSLSYISDPSKPVPSFANTDQGFSRDNATADQRFAVRRTDVLTYKGESLKEAVHIVGQVKAKLKLKLSTSDADMIVRLVDVRPDGSHILIRLGALPARYRKSFEKPEPVTPGQIEEIEITMTDINHIFMPGHRIEVLVCSSAFPTLAMSPQKFVENVYEADSRDYQKAEITIFGDSCIEYLQQ